jgi:hypothetical protein
MVSFSKFVILVEINKKTEEIEVLDPNGKIIVGEMVNLQKVNLLKSQLAKQVNSLKTPTRAFWSLYAQVDIWQVDFFQVDFLASWLFGKLTFWQVDFLAS